MKSTQDYVHILTLVQWSHAGNWRRGPDSDIVGIYNSKAAAVAKSVTVQTDYGTFDEAINDMFQEDHIDNRMNPPDNGILLKIGGDHCGEGDYCELQLKKLLIVGLQKQQSSKSQGRKNKASNVDEKANGRSPHKKRNKISHSSDDCIIIL